MQADKKDRQWTDAGVQNGCFDDLYAVVTQIRDEDPWDHEQTLESLRSNLLSEAVELIGSIEVYERSDDAGNLCEELGDLLLVMLLMIRAASEKDLFDAEDVISGIARKMIRRHPYVFGEEEAARCMPKDLPLPDDPADGDSDPEHIQRWMAIKSAEKQLHSPEMEKLKQEAVKNATDWVIDRLKAEK